jgi:hypothetical protein
MTKVKTDTVAQTQKRLSTYKFDTVGYIVLDSNIRRESVSGRLISTKPSSESNKIKK